MRRLVTLGVVAALACAGLACSSGDEDATPSEAEDETVALDDDRDGEGHDLDEAGADPGSDETGTGAATPPAELCALLEDLEQAVGELGLASDEDYEALLDASPEELRAGLERFAGIIGGQGPPAERTPGDETALDELGSWDPEDCEPRD